MSKKVKAILIGLLAFITATGAAIGITAQKSGGEKTEKETYRSSVQVQDEQNESEEASEADETSEENEADEQGEKAEANETSEENEADEADETAESAQFQSLAKITPEQAKSAALAEVSGTVKSVELNNENGNVVYDVEIQTAQGISEVKVDAGDGKVLNTENAAEDDGEDD